MQLKRSGRISQALAAATCTLLAGGGGSVQAADSGQLDITDLHYAEEGRITVDEQVFSLKRDRKNGRSFTLKLYHDTITGATPNGAADPATFTSPSGTPYTDTLVQIKDERYAVTADWERELTRLEKVSYGYSYSTELDYDSLGASWKKERDTSNRMRTYTYGASLNYDLIRAEGGIPTGLAPATDTTRYGSDNKVMADFLAGMTQVINRKTILQLNYSLGLSSGYLTDPYKFISVNDGSAKLQYEKRPNFRFGNSLYALLIYNHKDNVIRASYRYYMDDWGILSHTLDLRWYVQPHIRHYSQSAASFYSYIFYGEYPLTGYASSDYRLGNISGLTAGLQVGREFTKKFDANVRVEIIQQTDRLDEFAILNATVAQVSFRYKL